MNMSEPEKEISDKDLQKLLSLVKMHTGITMEARKRDMLLTRIRPQMRKMSLTSFEQFMDRVQSDPETRQKFIDLATTNETHFFRTETVWTYFTNDFLPNWFKQKPKDSTLRVWSAASSTGAEAYTIAMVCEEFKIKHPAFKYRVFASDISSKVLQEAQNGVYSDKILEEFKTKRPLLHQKYFLVLSPTQGQVNDFIRKQVEFSMHNLHTKAPRKDFYDIVFLRNVMIYFSEPDQELVLKNMQDSLKKDGLLIVGESESLSRLKTNFQYAQPLVYKKSAA